MRNRKLIALLLSVLMVLGTVSLPAFAEDAVEEVVLEEIAEEITEEAEEIAEEVAVEETAAEEAVVEETAAEEEEEVTLSDVTAVYVSPSGSDSNDGLTKNTPVATVDKAAALLTNGGTIYLADGNYSFASDLPEHTEMITFTRSGAWNGAMISFGGKATNGPVTVAGGLKYSGNVATGGHKFVMSASYIASATVAVSGYVTGNVTYPFEFEWNQSKTISDIRFGHKGASANVSIPGGNFVLNNGGGQIIIGDNGSTSKLVYFTAPVAITVNGGEWSGYFWTNYKRPVYQQGLSVILNNGEDFPITNEATSGSYTNYPDANKRIILRSGAEAGGTLSATGTHGVYTVNAEAGFEAKATDGTNTYISAGQVLTIPTGGDYTVTYVKPFSWEEAEDTSAAYYYVAANGSDENDGLTAEAPLASLATAITKLGAIKKSFDAYEVRIVGSYTQADALPSHTKTIKLIGTDKASSALSFSSNVFNNGPLVIDNLALTVPNEIYMQGNDIEFGENTTFTTGFFHANNYANAPANGIDIVINSTGSAGMIVAGPNKPSGNQTINGPVNITVGGASSGQFVLGGRSGNFVINYNAPVTYTINNNGWNFYQYGFYNCRPIYNGGFQVIMNNGTAYGAHVNNAANIFAGSQASVSNFFPGGKWEMSSAAQEGCYLSGTATAGTFAVTAPEGYMAVATDGTNTYTSAAGTLIVPAGIYTVTYEKEPEIYDWSAVEGATEAYFYIAADGSDKNPGNTAAAPLATLSKAIAALEELPARFTKREVRIIGTYTHSGDMLAHENMITIVGSTGSSNVFKLTAGFSTNGPIAFENIGMLMTAQWQGVTTAGGDLYIGEGVVTDLTNGYDFSINLGKTDADVTEVLDVTIKSGNWGSIIVGGRTNTAVRSTAGANILIEGGSGNLYFGEEHGGWNTVGVGQKYTGDVKIVNNGGAFNICFYPNTYGKNPTFEGAFQVILNNGATLDSSDNIIDNYTSGVFNGGKWIMHSADTNGNALEETATAGTFNVVSPKNYGALAISGTNKYASSNGVLTVPSGEYTVEYPSYTNDGMTISVGNDTAEIDFAEEAHKEFKNKVFLGWAYENGEFAESGVIAAGTELTAQYFDLDRSYEGEEDNADFGILGVQIRLPYSIDGVPYDQGLRFVVERSETLVEAIGSDNITEYGTLVLPTEYHNLNKLTLEGVYTYKDREFSAAVVEAVKTYRKVEETPNQDRIYYTAVLTKISEWNYLRDYTARGYIKYVDGNGVEQVLYSDEYYTSIYKTCDYAIENNLGSEYIIAALKDLMKAAEDAYFSQSTTVRNGSADDLRTYLYKYDDSNVWVRETVIETEKGGDDVVIAQFSDVHINWINDVDREINDPVIMSSWENRTLNPNGEALPRLRDALEFANFFDYTILTGDLLDYQTYGAVEVLQTAIWDKYPEVVVTTGNHEFSRNCGGKVPDTMPLDQKYEFLEEAWAGGNNLYYHSDILGDKVMAVSLDNGNEKFTAEQVAALEADIATAKENGYIILLFWHVPVKTNNPADTALGPFHFGSWNDANGKSKTNFCDGVAGLVIGSNMDADTEAFYNLVTSNADVIKGIFTGHKHADYYMEIQAKTSTGEDAVIPQYVMSFNQKITYPQVLESDYTSGAYVHKITIK